MNDMEQPYCQRLREGGDLCEIEPGVWFYFEPMPLSDEEVMDRYTALRAALTESAREERRLEMAADRHFQRHGDFFVRHVAKHGLPGDGRDWKRIAPKTYAAGRDAERALADAQSHSDAIRSEIAHLERWYPVTLRKVVQR